MSKPNILFLCHGRKHRKLNVDYDQVDFLDTNLKAEPDYTDYNSVPNNEYDIIHSIRCPYTARFTTSIKRILKSSGKYTVIVNYKYENRDAALGIYYGFTFLGYSINTVAPSSGGSLATYMIDKDPKYYIFSRKAENRAKNFMEPIYQFFSKYNDLVNNLTDLDPDTMEWLVDKVSRLKSGISRFLIRRKSFLWKSFWLDLLRLISNIYDSSYAVGLSKPSPSIQKEHQDIISKLNTVDLLSFSTKLEKTKLIAQGQEGIIYKLSGDGYNYALKSPRRANREEIKILKYLSKPVVRPKMPFNHLGVVHFYRTFYRKGFGKESNKEEILLEYIDGPTLTQFITKNKNTPPKEYYLRVLQIFWMLLDTIEYIHSRGIMHRDINLDNIMINSKGQTKLVDFGVAISGDKTDYPDQGTRIYIPPSFYVEDQPNELNNSYKVGKEEFEMHDLFSLGYVTLCLLTREIQPRYMKEYSWYKLHPIDEGVPYIWKNVLKDLRSLFSKEMLQLLDPLLVVVTDLLTEHYNLVSSVHKRYEEIFKELISVSDIVVYSYMIKRAYKLRDTEFIKYLAYKPEIKTSKNPDLELLQIILSVLKTPT